MYLLGTTLIVLVILSALIASACFTLVVSGRTALLRWGRAGVWSAVVGACAAALLLLALFVLQRYDVRYVYDYSSTDLELRFRVAAVWAGQPGSLVVWALVGLLCAPLLIRRTRQLEPYVLATLMLLQALILVFVLARNPFTPTVIDGVASRPDDGRGLNPILHNVWMVIHPPTLFTGYGLLGVPFCMALAGLWRRDYDGWVRAAMPWTIAGWGVLGLALTMGGYWAYESLGWGGYWGWDPVENAALVPWLTSTALVHGLLLQRTHGGLRRTNVALAILTYGFVLYASFLTRSGVLSNFSVHSFVEEGLKGIMLGTMIVILSASVLLLLLRWRDIPRRPLSEVLLSRHTMFVLMILTFVVLGVVISFGNSMPWITSIPGLSFRLERIVRQVFPIDDGTLFNGQPLGDGRFSLTPEFFTQTTPPLALVLAMLMAIGPLLGWRDTSAPRLLRLLRWPFALAVLLTSVGILLGVRDPRSMAFLLIATFAAGTNLLMIVQTLRAGWLRIGGYLAHVGMAVLLVGVIGSSAYASPEEKLVLPQGETQRIYGHSFTFEGFEGRPDNKHVLRLTADRDTDTPFVALPELYFNERMGAWVRTPAIRRSLWQDLYISPEEYVPADDPSTAILAPGEHAQIGPYAIRFDRFALQDHMASAEYALIGSTVTITHESTVQVLTPWLRLEPDRGRTSLPVRLPGGNDLVLERVSAGDELIRLRVLGLDLPVLPARAVFTVSVKPAIALVWLGAVLITVGGGIAVARRRWEVAGARVPLVSAAEPWSQRASG
ncbi:MAG TPA: cytochrome c biogenesis protein CcsA [Herpetosiphonaceae bacterium]